MAANPLWYLRKYQNCNTCRLSGCEVSRMIPDHDLFVCDDWESYADDAPLKTDFVDQVKGEEPSE
jgi:hypothetical protein